MLTEGIIKGYLLSCHGRQKASGSEQHCDPNLNPPSPPLFHNSPLENNLRRIQVTGGGPEVCTNPAGADYDTAPRPLVTSPEQLISSCAPLVCVGA